VRWYAIVPATLAVVAIAVPWMLAHWPEIGLALQRGFALVCHQRPERSFILFGGRVAVCARCLGIYIGAAVGLLIVVARQVAWRLLLAAVSINAIDWLAELSGLHGNWIAARFLLGLTVGATAAMLVIASIDKIKIPTQAKAA
jgi:uncharacterized membrane protein